jgi:hypothetical protein
VGRATKIEGGGGGKLFEDQENSYSFATGLALLASVLFVILLLLLLIRRELIYNLSEIIIVLNHSVLYQSMEYSNAVVLLGVHKIF